MNDNISNTNSFDVIIVGGGTAGLMLARELGKLKHRVLILDRKDNLLHFSFNTLGSFIKLDDFGLSKNVVAQEIDYFVIASKRLSRKIKVRAYILDKKKVHKEILESIDSKYVTIALGVNIKNIELGEGGMYSSVTDSNGNKYLGRIFVDASGTNGVLSKKIGLQEKKTELATGVEYNVKYLGKPNEAYLLIGKDYEGGYGWIFPLKNQRAIIGFGTFEKKVVKELKNRMHKIIELPKIQKLVEKDNNNIEGGSIPITPVLDKFVDRNLVCVGDSVSQVNPIVGEGYKFIFEAAMMASQAIDHSLKNKNLDYLNEYEVIWRKRFLKNYKRSKKAQERIFKFSSSDFLINFGILLSKLRSNAKNLKSISGEYD